MKKLGHFVLAVCIYCWLACPCYAGKSFWEGTVGPVEAKLVVNEETGTFRLIYGNHKVFGQFYDCFPTVSGIGRVRILNEAGEIVGKSSAALKAELYEDRLIGSLFISKECYEANLDLVWKATR